MAEIQQVNSSADLTQRFIELVMMNAQQAALCLGQMPHPSTGKAEVNLDAAKMFIDHLEIIREKTRGNLNKDEEKILASILSELQLAFVQVAGGHVAHTDHVHNESGDHEHVETSTPEVPVAAPVAPQPETPSPAPSASDDEEGKKRFTKSYGS
jgi:hypothetical protein